MVRTVISYVPSSVLVATVTGYLDIVNVCQDILVWRAICHVPNTPGDLTVPMSVSVRRKIQKAVIPR